MPKFSQESLDKLETCHYDLQILFEEVIKYIDCTVLEGFRGKSAQDKAFAEGKSQLQWPNGKHNKSPSNAVDVAPYPIDWKDRELFIFFGGFVLGIAERLFQQGAIAHKIRWGGDWNSDKKIKDNKFDDLVHFEIIL